MSGIKLWDDLDYENENDEDENLYEDENLSIELEDNDFDLFEIKCVNCGAIVDDGYQCEVCGWLVGV